MPVENGSHKGPAVQAFLAYPEALERFLDEIFEKCPIRISVKTRLGMEQPEEFVRILEIYNRFPMEELIIHPRVQKDFYKNTPNLEIFGCALAESRNPVCYNGDIFTPADFARFTEEYRSVERVMTGRGVLRDPALAREIRGGRAADRNELRRFHDLVVCGVLRGNVR